MTTISKWIEAFLEFKNEASATRKFALFAVAIITIGLISLAVTGVIATADWGWVSLLPIIGTIIAIGGSEILASVAFIRAIQAPTLKRKIAGYLIFIGLAAVGVHNAERGVRVVWPALYEKSSAELAARASLAGEEASLMGEAAKVAVDNSGAELERVRTEIASLKAEQTMLSAQSPEGIAKAQSHLQAIGLYFGREDGISDVKTESARRQRGEQIAEELKVLKAREDGFMTGVASPVQSATTDKRILEIEMKAAADAIMWAVFWVVFMLITWEGARSLGLWALITDVTGKNVDDDRRRANELAEEEHANRLAELRAQRLKPPPEPIPVPEPIVAAPEPAPEPPPVSHPEPVEAVAEPAAPIPPPEPELTDAQRRSRAGGLGAGQAKAAARAKAERLILVPSLVERDAEIAAAKVAAQ
jgi:hypothetical protein